MQTKKYTGFLTVNSRRVCFVTEVDLERESAGAIIDDYKFLSCLKEIAPVDTIYLQKKKYRSMWSSFVFFVLRILNSFSKSYQIYFSRGLVTSFILLSFSTFLGKQNKIVHKTPIPFSSNETKFLKYNKLEFLVRYSLFRFLEKVVMQNVDAIIVPSSNYAATLVENGIKESKVFVIPYYIEEEFFEQPIKQSEDEIFTFTYVGGFHSYHDLAPIIEAFEILNQYNKNAKLVLVGDGVMRPEIEKLVHLRKLDNTITFRGRMPHSSVANFLSETDAFLYMAQTTGMSTSVLEAAAAGKPIITLKKKGDSALTRYFHHGREIFLVSSLSANEIARALEQLYSDSRLRVSLSEGARKVAIEHFNKKATLKELEKLLHAVTIN